MKYVTLGVSILLSIVFIASGGAKLLGSDAMVATFDRIGAGQWFRYVTAVFEISSVILLWVRGGKGCRSCSHFIHNGRCCCGTSPYFGAFSDSSSRVVSAFGFSAIQAPSRNSFYQ
jgi:DoxX-like family